MTTCENSLLGFRGFLVSWVPSRFFAGCSLKPHSRLLHGVRTLHASDVVQDKDICIVLVPNSIRTRENTPPDPSSSFPLFSGGATCARISEILADDMSCSRYFPGSALGVPGSKVIRQVCLSEPYSAESLIFGESEKSSETGVPSRRGPRLVEAP